MKKPDSITIYVLVILAFALVPMNFALVTQDVHVHGIADRLLLYFMGALSSAGLVSLCAWTCNKLEVNAYLYAIEIYWYRLEDEYKSSHLDFRGHADVSYYIEQWARKYNVTYMNHDAHGDYIHPSVWASRFFEDCYHISAYVRRDARIDSHPIGYYIKHRLLGL